MEWTMKLAVVLLPIGVGLLSWLYGYAIGRAHGAESARYRELDY